MSEPCRGCTPAGHQYHRPFTQAEYRQALTLLAQREDMSMERREQIRAEIGAHPREAEGARDCDHKVGSPL